MCPPNHGRPTNHATTGSPTVVTAGSPGGPRQQLGPERRERPDCEPEAAAVKAARGRSQSGRDRRPAGGWDVVARALGEVVCWCQGERLHGCMMNSAEWEGRGRREGGKKRERGNEGGREGDEGREDEKKGGREGGR
eukprot:278855-Chlamydomonas_euryale.AAC.2